MPNALDQIVNITITQQTQAVPQAGFGVPLIVGPNAPWGDAVRYYSSAAGLLSDGFISSNPEYIYASEAFEQALSPTLVGIGKRTAAVKQVDTFAVNTLVTSHVYSFTLNTVVISYTALGGDAKEDVLAALLTAIGVAFPTNPPVTGAVTGSGNTALLTLTSSTFGQGVSYASIDADLTHVNTVANHSIQDDLQSIINFPVTGNLWYGLALIGNQDYDILQAAAFIEGVEKIFVAASGDGAIDSSAVTDIASVLQGKAYKRTALLFSPGSYNLGADAAWLGGQLPQIPGSSTWKFKQLNGISPDSFTANSRARLIGTPGVTFGKGVNIYETVGGRNITEEGWMVGGQFIDITVGLDWLKSTMQTNIFSQLVNNPKIPYTDKGIGVIENAVRQTLKQASDDGGTGLLDHTSITISVVPVSSIPQNTRAQRILPTGAIAWTARLAGAFHFVFINGIVTV